MLIQFTKPAIRLSKNVVGAAIKNVGHPGRWFLAAWLLIFVSSPLCALALKLLKKLLKPQRENKQQSQTKQTSFAWDIQLDVSYATTYIFRRDGYKI